ncbi:DUF4861 family protein [Marinagarivorans cellulosilyticus]|uniref:Unsaturated rhamnogalacturonyl hydrolase n=1 Tax=Marinagarivorans cellulosilyticus TaxID=2721545 RepID=A0AAN1WJ98_9GAMM|nr:DUF4861 family protein [Marinagarivorans cellulosilyticus]BCD98623.1 hypothetical protein MARGE09_P2824 [Marinagarivorans cellulosilyticus]
MIYPPIKKYCLLRATKKWLVASIALSLCACATSKQSNNSASAIEAPSTFVANISVGNPSDFMREKSPLYFSYNELGVSGTTLLVALRNGVAQPTQAIDVDADGILDGIAIALDLKAYEQVDLSIQKVKQAPNSKKLTQAEISHKVGGEWVPHTRTEGFQEYVGGEFQNVQSLTPPKQYTDHSNWIRYEGPGIESDKVAYRVYLDGRNGFDIFGKISPDPVLQKIGQVGYSSYHEMQPWGMDILKVGSSLGVGGFGFYDGNKIVGVNDVASHTATVTNNGPIFSGVKIDYKNWNINGQTLDVNAHLTMRAGSRLVHNSLTLSESLPNLAIGFVKHKNTEFIEGSRDVAGDSYSYVASWGQQSLNGDHLGMAVIFSKRDFRDVLSDENSYAIKMDTAGNELNYYFLAAWEGEHGKGINNREDFIVYLEREVEKLTQANRVSLKTSLSQKDKSGALTSEKALDWSYRLAESELKRKTMSYHVDGWDVNRRRKPKFEYDIIGMLPWSYHELGKALDKPEYDDILHHITGSFINDAGEIQRYTFDSYNIDAVAPGRTVLSLYKLTGEEKYRKAADLLRKQLEQHPRTTEGAFWHKKKYTSQLWLDGVYMGMPFLAEYSMLFEGGHALEEVVKEFVLTEKYLRDPKTGLYYHAWDEKKAQVWASPETGLSPHFWSRGMGWFAMALVDVLDIIPESKPELRAPLIRITQDLAKALIDAQDKATHTWWQIADMPNKPGNYRESSASAMFTYFLAKAVNKNYLSQGYKAEAIKAYNGLISEFVNVNADGTISMTNQCLVAGLGFGRDGSYKYYMSERVFQDDPKGTVPFMITGIEIAKLLQQD